MGAHWDDIIDLSVWPVVRGVEANEGGVVIVTLVAVSVERGVVSTRGKVEWSVGSGRGFRLC